LADAAAKIWRHAGRVGISYRLPVRDYLAAILPGLADFPIQRLPELTPAAYPHSSAMRFF
jgi:hypothetical protein